MDLNIHRDNGQNRYTGVFRQGAGAHYLWANVTWEGFRAKWQELAEGGLRLMDYEFPAPEIGLGLGSEDSGFEGEEPLVDLGLDEDGFGGIFDAADGAPSAAAFRKPRDSADSYPVRRSDRWRHRARDGVGAAELPDGGPREEEAVLGMIGGGG